MASPRAWLIGRPAVSVLVAGSYNSVAFVAVVLLSNPPAISILPLGSSVAVAEARATVIGGLDVLEGRQAK